MFLQKKVHLRAINAAHPSSRAGAPEHTPLKTVLSSDGHRADFGETLTNPKAFTAAARKSKSWPLAYALGLGLLISGLLWIAAGALIHYLRY